MSAAEALRKGERAGSVSNLRFMPCNAVGNAVRRWTRDAVGLTGTFSGEALEKSTREVRREEGALGRSTQEPRLEMGEDGDAGDCLITTDIPFANAASSNDDDDDKETRGKAKSGWWWKGMAVRD